MSYPIYWLGSPKYTPGHPAPLIAIVHHRMVGTLRSTDAAFANPDGRAASTNFGVGYACGVTGHPASDAHIHQYVALGNMAWGNGNWDATGAWDDRYPTSYVNSRTISIEHHDNGGRMIGTGKGVVPEKVIVASLWLDALLLRGNLAEMRAAGIRFRDAYADAIARELRAIPLDRHHIVDHHYIAGRLKPYCWRPWADDKVGFPQARYLGALAIAPTLPDTSTGDTMQAFSVPEHPTRVMLKEDPARPGNSVWMFSTDAFAKDGSETSLQPIRWLNLVGDVGTSAVIVAYEPATADSNTYSKAMYVRPGDIAKREVIPAPVTDCSAQVAAAKAAQAAADKALIDAAKAEAAAAKASVDAAVAAAVKPLRDRLARAAASARDLINLASEV